MSGDVGQVRTPTVLWAQRRDRVFLTIDLPNAESPKVNLRDEGTLSFSAMAGPADDQHKYAVELEVMHPVNAKDSKISVGPRNVVVMVMKTEEVRGRLLVLVAVVAFAVRLYTCLFYTPLAPLRRKVVWRSRRCLSSRRRFTPLAEAIEFLASEDGALVERPLPPKLPAQ